MSFIRFFQHSDDPSTQYAACCLFGIILGWLFLYLVPLDVVSYLKFTKQGKQVLLIIVTCLLCLCFYGNSRSLNITPYFQDITSMNNVSMKQPKNIEIIEFDTSHSAPSVLKKTVCPSAPDCPQTPLNISCPLSVLPAPACPIPSESKSVPFDYKYLGLATKEYTGIIHPVPFIQELINTCKTKPSDYLGLATANMAHLPLVLNMLASVEKNMEGGIHILIVCLDSEIFTALKKLNIPALHVNELFDYTKQEQMILSDANVAQEGVYGKQNYWRLCFLKIDVAYIILKYYDLGAIVYTDTDAVFLYPTMTDYFDQFLHSPKLLPDGSKISPDMLFSYSGMFDEELICTGFYVAKKSNFSLNMLGYIMSSSMKVTEGDQDGAIRYYRTILPHELKRRIHLLDNVFFTDTRNQQLQARFKIKPWYFHANWLVGLDKKCQAMRDLNYNYVPLP